MLTKRFVNESGFHLRVTIFLRFGDDSLMEGGAKSFAVKKGEAEEVTLSTNRKAMINGIGVSYFDAECSMYFEKKILEAGTRFDLLINAPDEMIIEDPTKLAVPCSVHG
jgi:hypothetical protein